MFLNPQLIEDAQENANQNTYSSQKQQPKGRSNVTRFQAKQKDEPKQEAKQEIKQLSRIQQKEQEMQKKAQEQQMKQEEELGESLVQFDSDPEQEDRNQLIVPQSDTRRNDEDTIPIQPIKNQSQTQFQQFSKLQNNSQYKKNLGKNESSYGQDYDIEFDKFDIIGNNHNQYYEPGQQQNNDNNDSSLPQLTKTQKYANYDELQLKNNKPKQQEPVIQKQQDYEEMIEVNDQEEELIDVNQKDAQEILDQQEKEDEQRKEQKLQHEKVQMDLNQQNETPDQEEEIQRDQDQKKKEEKQSIQNDQPKQTCPYPKPLLQIEMPDGKKHFLLNPAPKGGMVQCTIKRDRSGMCRFYPKYHMHISNGFLYLMSGKKRACNNTSNYIISLSREDLEKGNNFIGKVRSNFMGTEFVLYDHGENPEKTKDPNQYRQQLGVVCYESNILGSKGPRKMVVLLPKLNDRDQMYVFKPGNAKDGILKDYTGNQRDHIQTYVNRPPQWNSKHKAFVLNFYQRVDKPSVKNFQLIYEGKEDNILLQFGRVGDDLFNLDFQYPITPLQAFEIALTSFDYKIACE